MADNYLRPQSDTRLAQMQNSLVSAMAQVKNMADNLKLIEDQLAIIMTDGNGNPIETSDERWARVAAEFGYTGLNALVNVEAAYNLKGSVVSSNLAGFYEQMLGRMG